MIDFQDECNDGELIVACLSRTQKSGYFLSAEAEYVAIGGCVAESVLARRMLKSMVP